MNSCVRIPEQIAWANMMTDLSYGARMNEIEWNNSDAGSYSLTQAVQMASRIRRYGLKMTMSVDQTAYAVTKLYWQEGIPIIGSTMRVTDTSFVPVAEGFGVDFTNGGFESWSGSGPANWTMTRDSLFAHVSRDSLVRHSGSNSIRFTGFGGGTYPDSSLNYFAANGHESVMALGLWVSASRFVSAVQAATRHSNCQGTEFYVWQGDCDADLPRKTTLFGDLSWNMGPYIIHDPAQPPNMNDSLRIVAEMWSDTFGLSTPPGIVSADARCRTLPGGSWATVPMTQIGTGRFAAALAPAGAEVTAIEYYLTATDNRGQIRYAPADAPQKTFVVNMPGASQSGTTGGDRVDRRLSMISDCWMLEWKSERDVD